MTGLKSTRITVSVKLKIFLFSVLKKKLTIGVLGLRNTAVRCQVECLILEAIFFRAMSINVRCLRGTENSD